MLVQFCECFSLRSTVNAGQKWTLMQNISVTEYLNFEGTQFSKSRGIGVFGNDAKQTGIPVEVRQIIYTIMMI